MGAASFDGVKQQDSLVDGNREIDRRALRALDADYQSHLASHTARHIRQQFSRWSKGLEAGKR
jgi:hypothetical protein